MKHFILLKLSVLAFGAAAALLLTPACKAQSEVSPDHFDGTDSWAAATRPVQAQPKKQFIAKPSLQAKSQKAGQDSAFQLAAVREATKPVRQEAGVVDHKRKPPAPNSDKPRR